MNISNAKRATWAEAALETWREQTGLGRSESDVQDLMYDLLHLLKSEGRDALSELEDLRETFEADKNLGLV